MKKIHLFLLIFCFTVSYSQNAQEIINKLKKDLSSNPDDKKTASIYSDLTWYYANISVDSSLFYGSKAIKEAERLKDSTLLAQIYSDLGAVYFRKTDFEASKNSYLIAYKIRKIRNDKTGMAKIAANLANVYNKQNQKELALKSYLESVEYFEKTNNFEAAALTNANISSLFMDLKNYQKASKYLNKAIQYQEENNKLDGLSTSYLTKGNIFLRLSDTLNALKYYKKCLKISREIGNKISEVAVLNNISKIKNDQNKGNESKILNQQSAQILSKINKSKDDTSLSLNVVSSLITDHKFLEAKKILLKLKKEYSNEPAYFEDLIQTYNYLIQTSSQLNQKDSVSFYSNAIMRLQDKIIEQTVRKQTNEFETKYQTVKKEKLIAQQKEEVKYKNILLLGLTIIVFFIALFGFLIFRQQKLKNKQQKQEFELKSAITQIEKQNELQQQRLSISKDLHDNIGAQLTFIISSVETAKYVADIKNTTLESKLSNISNFTKDTIVELRDTIWAMNSETINFEDLRLRILNFIEKATTATTDISFNFMVDNALKNTHLSSVQGMNVYRCIQEAINNAIKYSEANNILVEVILDKNEIKIIIKDNGKGFDVETISNGNGLQNMQKRMEEIGGTFQIVSEPTKGTQIKLNFKS
ncbi:MAG: sensor histidine kinase [Flavobacterium sp.]|jgi:signal transduction histidine kinase|uniref:tetratricopeptide repeat-containing sensor histidine kinase n=1 Tax=Flavobacterium sp. TaxID=239 RepID=UPI002CABEE1C|nr:sensor histidine kinase [Flavobacterium sp.]MCA0348698.1 sensor histidine kinase [Bacteroidota bacterium]HQA75237.1 sensor histidine kinase [Flavobacterium sp.]